MAASKDFAAHPLHTAAAAAALLATLAATSPVAATPVETAAALQEILIRGGTVVTSEGRFDADVRVRDGTIVEIGAGLAAGAGAREIDATGLRVMPGGLDPHVHLGGRTRDDYRTGSQAALAGGITTISNFAFPVEGRTLAQAIEREAALIREQAIADVILHAGINDPAAQEGQMTTLGACAVGARRKRADVARRVSQAEVFAVFRAGTRCWRGDGPAGGVRAGSRTSFCAPGDA